MKVGIKRKNPATHGNGLFRRSQFARIGKGVIFEKGALVFHPENIEIGDHVYIGHYVILKGYYKNKMYIGPGTWIGQQCFFHSAGGLRIGRNVGVGPGVKIITSYHAIENKNKPILHNPVQFKPVIIGDGSDIGTGAVILPGVRIGRYAQVGAGSVVTKDIADHDVVAGVPAKRIKKRR